MNFFSISNSTGKRSRSSCRWKSVSFRRLGKPTAWCTSSDTMHRDNLTDLSSDLLVVTSSINGGGGTRVVTISRFSSAGSRENAAMGLDGSLVPREFIYEFADVQMPIVAPAYAQCSKGGHKREGFEYWGRVRQVVAQDKLEVFENAGKASSEKVAERNECVVAACPARLQMKLL